jgi:hypothetical protein
MNYSLGIQRDIGLGTVLDVAYVAALGRHLLERVNLNTTPLGASFLPQNLDATNKNAVLPSQFLRPYQGYGDIQYYLFGANSSYHSLQATMRRRYKSSLTYGAMYTWSKAMDYADEDASNANESVSSLVSPKIFNYGKAGFDHTHIFRFYWNYNLPRVSQFAHSRFVRGGFDNWQISGIFTAQSGAPMGISCSSSPTIDYTGSTEGNCVRVDLVANPVAVDRTIYQAFNTAANAPPTQETLGNAPKDVFRGPGRNNWDISLFKNFVLHGERWKGQFRVEAYSAFNHTNFSGVDTADKFNSAGQQTNTIFGQYNAAVFPRRLQLAMRVMF